MTAVDVKLLKDIFWSSFGNQPKIISVFSVQDVNDDASGFKFLRDSLEFISRLVRLMSSLFIVKSLFLTHGIAQNPY